MASHPRAHPRALGRNTVVLGPRLLVATSATMSRQTYTVLSRRCGAVCTVSVHMCPLWISSTLVEIDQQGRVQLRLKKNTNENLELPKVWRYQHWHSATSYTLKRTILLAALKKVHKMANNNTQLEISARAKIAEFQSAGYPYGVIKYMCNIMAIQTNDISWGNILQKYTTPYFPTSCPTLTSLWNGHKAGRFSL